MKALLFYLFIMFICYMVSYKLVKDREKFHFVSVFMTWMVYVMVFVMGLRMGSNEEVISGLGTIGLQALLVTLLTMGLSMFMAYIVRKVLGLNRHGLKPEEELKEETCKVQSPQPEKNGESLKSSIIIIMIVIVGMISGYFLIPQIFSEISLFENMSEKALSICLCLLLACVGFDLGNGGNLLDKFKSIGFKAILMPLAIIIGTLGGSVIFSLITGISLKESLAIGAGFAWYSMAPGIIMEAGYITASAISFLHNVMREMFAIIFMPVLADKIGYFEATALPASPGMDVCLPIVEKSTNAQMAIYSLISGLILSLLVPVLVPLIIGW